MLVYASLELGTQILSTCTGQLGVYATIQIQIINREAAVAGREVNVPKGRIDFNGCASLTDVQIGRQTDCRQTARQTKKTDTQV